MEGGKQNTARHLTDAWIARNLSLFDESIAAITGLVSFALYDTASLPQRGLFEKVVMLVKKGENSR